MADDDTLALLGPSPSSPGTSTTAGDETWSAPVAIRYLRPQRRCAWTSAVLDHRHRLRLPAEPGAELMLAATASAIALADPRWFLDNGVEVLDEFVDVRLDARARLRLPGSASAHIDARPGDPIAIGVELEGRPALHLVGPGRFENVIWRGSRG